MLKRLMFLLITLILFQGGCLAMVLTSPAFKNGATIPALHTCEGKDISPALHWIDVSEGTKSFALIVTDIDAPAAPFDHWIIFNLPANMREIKTDQQQFPAGVTLGNNTWGGTKYRGPCPPSGEHRYYFKLYALDTILGLNSGTYKQQLEQAMQGHILANAELMGKYKKNKTN